MHSNLADVCRLSRPYPGGDDMELICRECFDAAPRLVEAIEKNSDYVTQCEVCDRSLWAFDAVKVDEEFASLCKRCAQERLDQTKTNGVPGMPKDYSELSTDMMIDAIESQGNLIKEIIKSLELSHGTTKALTDLVLSLQKRINTLEGYDNKPRT